MLCVGLFRSKKTSRFYVVLVYDLGYRRIYLTFNRFDISEVIGCSPRALADLCNNARTSDDGTVLPVPDFADCFGLVK